jgi:hypothetical protein
MRLLRLCTAALTCAALMGCAHPPQPLYDWGIYQPMVYEYLRGDGKSPAEQLGLLDEQLHKTAAAGTAVPPGLHAHMGLLNLQLGQDADGVAHLEAERRLFPESTPYIDWLLKQKSAHGQEATP